MEGMSDTILDALKKRRDGLSEALNGDPCFTDQKHTDEGTQERIYWHYGYLIAVRDIINLLESGNVRPN
jgi:hypothetical protein